MNRDEILARLNGRSVELADLAKPLRNVAGELDDQDRPADAGTVRALANLSIPDLIDQLDVLREEFRSEPLLPQGVELAVERLSEFLGAFDTAFAGLESVGSPSSNDLLRHQVSAARNHIVADIEELEQSRSEVGALNRIGDSVEDLTSYPMLTSQHATSTPGRDRGMQHLLDSAIRSTLGRLPKYTDHKAFVTALNSSFEVEQVEGRSVAVWRPRSYAGQSELGGGVTGAQASLHARARDALNSALPLIKGLTPLDPAADREEMEAVRGILHTQFSAIADELAIEGGPRAARVNELFSVLLDNPVVGADGRQIEGGMIGYARSVFGIDEARVNTPEEERVFSDFLLLTDHIVTTRASWASFRDNLLGRDLGTRLVLLSNALQVVAESVDQAEAVLDSVLVGPAERSVARFPITGGGSMLIAELMGWVTTFASQEARELIHQGGRRALGAVANKADTLRLLVQDLRKRASNAPDLPDGLRHPRVRFALRELETYLQQAANQAAAAKAPVRG